MWLAWLLYWFVAAFNVKKNAQVQSLKGRLAYQGQMVLTALLLFAAPLYIGPFSMQILPNQGTAGETCGVVGALLTLIGLFFAAWARLHLGANWSGRVTLKENHELIQTGPYGITRHPIYTGMIGGILGTAITVGQVRSLLAVVIFVQAIMVKLKQEEELMKAQFPAEYGDYEKRVKRLIPFLY